MKLQTIAYYLFILPDLTISLHLKPPKSELVFAHVVYRHGDRAPGSVYPNDPNSPEDWPAGFKELTEKGITQQYLLGKYLRRRYADLLDEQYFASEIYVRSTDKNRALQSAQSNLHGLYPPLKHSSKNTSVPWQVVPVHSVELDEDYLLEVTRSCPEYDVVYRAESKDTVDSYNKKYAGFFEHVKNYSGLKQLDLEKIGSIYDPLYCETVHHLKLPHWTKNIADPTTSQTVYELIVQLKMISKNLKYNSDKKARFTGGPLLGDIINRMIRVSVNKGNTAAGELITPSKMVMFSAHDDTVMALLYALNIVKHPFVVPYAGTVLFDLYRDEHGRHYVEVYYKDNTPNISLLTTDDGDANGKMNPPHPDEELSPLHIPGCPGHQCPLDTFAAVLTNRTLYPRAERDKICRKNKGQLQKQATIGFED